MLGGFVKNSRHSELFSKSLLFHQCSHLLGDGGHLLPRCLSIVDGFSCHVRTVQGKQATWVHKFPFISPTIAEVVGSTHFGRPAGPLQTP